MKESDYIKASDLARVRAAREMMVGMENYTGKSEVMKGLYDIALLIDNSITIEED